MTMLSVSRSAYEPANEEAAALWALPIVAYTIGFQVFRPFGIWLLALVILTSIGSIYCARRVVGFWTFFPLLLVSTMMLFVSLAGLAPSSWTVYRDVFAALRQWSWVIIIPIATSAFSAFLGRHYTLIQKNALALLCIVFAITCLSRMGTTRYVGEGQTFTLYVLSNDVLPVYLLLIFLVLSKSNLLLRISVFVVVALLSSSTQSQVLMIAIFATWVLPWPRLVSAGLFFSLLAFVLIAPWHALELYGIDHNSGLRAQFWHDALIALSDSSGLGVGFGNEFIASNFRDVTHSSWSFFLEDDSARLYISTHSVVYDVLMKTGVLGLAALLFFYWRLFATKSHMTLHHSRLFCSIFNVLVVASLVNPGFTTLNFSLGASMCLALMFHITKMQERKTQRRDAFTWHGQSLRNMRT
ncbi:hypothetical protein [uncultured Maritalea sp.]|jgi:hypothetical protein|uniref:hypothetical protein n=1 Tax=uncultured Maritalea sp. TaxID=757249 RepID=UPI0026371FAC|nr:hypothetical protein [uncultured Maritalea sp.]